MSTLPAQRLQDAWQQCARHLHHLQHALQAVQSTLPLSAADLKAMDDEAVQAPYVRIVVAWAGQPAARKENVVCQRFPPSATRGLTQK